MTTEPVAYVLRRPDGILLIGVTFTLEAIKKYRDQHRPDHAIIPLHAGEEVK